MSKLEYCNLCQKIISKERYIEAQKIAMSRERVELKNLSDKAKRRLGL